MAINFAGLLGGLGAGAQQLAAQREQERQFNINRQFAERQFAESQLGRQQQYELQKSAAERADALAERQSRELRNKELGLANTSVINLLSADLQDEEKALEELRQPGLSPADIEGIRSRRRQRRKVVEDALASFDKMTGYSELYGSAASRLQASPIAGADALRVTPKVNWTQYADFLNTARKTIAAAAPAEQESEWANQVSQLATMTGAPITEVQTKLARPGSILEGITPSVTTKQRPLTPQEEIYGPLRQGQSPLSPGFRPSETLPTGGRVERTFDPATGMVNVTETGGPTKVRYTTPEMDQLKATALALKNQETTLLMDPKVKSAIEDLQTKRLRNILAQKEINWYDRIQASTIASRAAKVGVQKAQAAAKAGVQKGLSLADEIRMYSAESLNAYRDSQAWLATAKLREGKIARLSGEINKLETLANAAEVKAAESADKAMANVRSASMKVAKDLRAQAAELRKQLGYIESGNVQGMAAYTGSSLGAFNPESSSAGGLASFVQSGQSRIAQLMQSGVQGMQSGMQGQQPQAQGQGGVTQNFILGGPQGVASGGAGVGGAGGGGGVWWPGGGRWDPNSTPSADPKRIAQWQAKYPNVDPARVAGYVKVDGTIDSAAQQVLAALNEKAKKPKPEVGKPEPKTGKSEANKRTVPVQSGPKTRTETGWYSPGSNIPYTGTRTIAEDGKQYPAHPLEYLELKKAGRLPKPLEFYRRPPTVLPPGTLSPSKVRENVDRLKTDYSGLGTIGTG